MGIWKLKEYSIEELDNDIKNEEITVPPYQRGCVWKKSQKDQLIDSMNKGYPFGSILLYDDAKNKKMQIIDGLQRTTTIIEFVENPARFFTDDNIDDNILNDIISCIGVTTNCGKLKEELNKQIKSWVIENHNTMQDVERMQYSDLVETIAIEYPIIFENIEKQQELKVIVKNMFSKFQDMCSKISKMKIPALIYSGDESVLPEIFERINSQGSKLTKQQIYAATWSKDEIYLEDPKLAEIIMANRERYDNMLEENLKINQYDPTEFVKQKKIDIFELIFGFGKLISKRYPYLFSYDEKDKAKVESIGFNLINACLVQKSNNMNSLNLSIKKLITLDGTRITLFLNRILDAIEFVDRRLSAATKFKGNSRSGSKITQFHTEMQITSIIATVFVLRHASFNITDKGEVVDLKIDLDSSYNRSWGLKKEKFSDNVLKIYTMDILAQKWKGSGDKKLDSIIINDYYYTREVNWEEFEQTLNVYYTTMNTERNERKQVATPKEQEKLLLNLIYSSIFSATDQNDGSNYDIEHLATKNLMKEKLNNYSELSLPISSIGNLCLLPQYDNRTKKEKTIYQDDKYLKAIGNGLNEIERKFTFTIKSDLAWINEDLEEDQFKEAYMKFINVRFEKMKEKLKENLFNRQFNRY